VFAGGGGVEIGATVAAVDSAAAAELVGAAEAGEPVGMPVAD
jgi:hypothetical protein